MKRLRFMCLSLVLVIFVACGGAPAAPADTPAGATQPPELPTATAAADVVAPSDAGAAGGPLKTPYLEYGVAAQLFYTDRERALTLVNNAGFDWVRQQIHWKDIEGPKGNFGWDELDSIVNTANAKNIKVILSVVRSPDWARLDGTHGMPDNIADIGDFMEALAIRYKGKVQAYEIWNEQNLDHENGGSKDNIDAGRYVDMLVECYNRVKAVDPDAYIVSGALTSTGDTPTAVDDMLYYKQMFTYKDGIFKSHVDAVGFHPAPAYNSPDTLWPDNPGPGPGWLDSRTHYFRHIEDLRALMEEQGLGDYQIWITEMGWATENVTPGYEYGNSISFEQQGEYLFQALQRVRNEYPFVGVAVIWNLNFAILWNEQDPPQPLHEQSSFSILNTDWSPRPAFDRIQGFIHAAKIEEGRLPQ